MPAGFCRLYACLTPSKISGNFAFIEIIIPEPPRGNIDRQCQTTWSSVCRRLCRLVDTAEESNSGCIYCCSMTLTGPSNLLLHRLAQLGNTGYDGCEFPFGKQACWAASERQTIVSTELLFSEENYYFYNWELSALNRDFCLSLSLLASEVFLYTEEASKALLITCFLSSF